MGQPPGAVCLLEGCVSSLDEYRLRPEKTDSAPFDRTYVFLWLRPPRSILPSRPPTEALAAFCLSCQSRSLSSLTLAPLETEEDFLRIQVAVSFSFSRLSRLSLVRCDPGGVRTAFHSHLADPFADRRSRPLLSSARLDHGLPDGHHLTRCYRLPLDARLPVRKGMGHRTSNGIQPFA